MLPLVVAVMFIEPEVRSIEARRYHHNYRVLPPIGREAPEFSAATDDGGRISIPSLAKGKKATLVNFWFYDCSVCREELPEIQRIFAKTKDDGFAVVAVNVGDTLETVKTYRRNAGYTFPIALDESEVASLYGVSSFPTNMILDGEGRVVDRFIGFDERGMARALARLGLKVPHESPSDE
jgi:peroxiredoxin